MRSSDLRSFERLRHTSRIFVILFSVNPAFTSLHLTSDEHRRFYDTARLWEVPRSIIPTHQEAFFLEPWSLCKSFLKRREGDQLERTLLSSMSVLYCSGWPTTHREMHFSASMWNAINDDRMCVWHEGRLIVYSHQAISLQQAKLDAASGGRSLSCVFYHDTYRPICDSNTYPADNRPQVYAYCDEHRKIRSMLSRTSRIKVKRLQNRKICPSSLRK